MIIFYSMNGCGYCSKAKKELASEIASGLVVIKDAGEAKGVNGFPHFENPSTGAKHTGYAPKAELFQKLGVVSEGYAVEGFCDTCTSRNFGGYLPMSKTWSQQRPYNL